MNSTSYRFICILYTLGLLLGSLIPSDDSTAVSRTLLALNPEVQNLLHIPAFLGFAVLFLKSFRSIPESGLKKRYILVLVVGVMLGLLLETVQMAVPGRFPSLMDGMLNGVGICFGIWIYHQWKWLRLFP